MQEGIIAVNKIIWDIINKVTGLSETPFEAYNLRLNGKSAKRLDAKDIKFCDKADGKGIDIVISDNVKDKTIYMPVIVEKSGLKDFVYNDYFIGENSKVHIISGCGIHNEGTHLTEHDGTHTFHIGKNATVKYTEKHYGDGSGSGKKILNPHTIIHLDCGSRMEMETIQINGVDMTQRITKADIADDASLNIKEVIMTSGTQTATTDFQVDLNGKKSSANVVSRAVAKGESKQYFYSVINGNNWCSGHSECDAIIMDGAMVKAVPDVTANHVDAALIHEAAIGKIAGEQIIKLMTLGLAEEEAEEKIVEGFLR